MKFSDILLKALPTKKTDKYVYFLMLVAILPIIYICFSQRISYLSLNYACLLIFCGILFFEFIKNITKKPLLKKKKVQHI